MAARRYLSASLKKRVRHSAKNRCGYCLSPQRLVMARLEIEHIIPISRGGTDDEDNLWLACPICNGHKADKINGIDPITGHTVPLFNPRNQIWSAHFEWDSSGLFISGKTSIGRATIDALHLNDDADALLVRSNWIEAGWHPPSDLD